jgi:two-component system, response regulator FlrC
VIDTTATVTRAVWLDPFKPLGTLERNQLELAGISLSMVNTLGELNVALSRAHLLIIRLVDSAELLQEVLTLVTQLGHNVPVLCRIEKRAMNVVVDAMRLGAFHALPCDEWDPTIWADAVKGLTSVNQKVKSYVFVDPVSQHLLALAQRVAQTDVATLLVGPTGAGKEVLARVIHESSPRAKGPFVAMNCAAMPEHLIEDMLFGHEKGAFTGAQKDHKGLFEQGQGGTVFLDEIGEMPIQLQAKLLRVLQEKKLNRLGSEAAIDLDIRIVAATNKDLKLAIEKHEFREDLYFRISTFKLKISPLSQRPGDILPLVTQSFARHSKDKVPYELTIDAQRVLQQYPWPGNVRELENVVQRAVVLCSGKTISVGHLMFDESVNHELLMQPDAPILNKEGQVNAYGHSFVASSAQVTATPTTSNAQSLGAPQAHAPATFAQNGSPMAHSSVPSPTFTLPGVNPMTGNFSDASVSLNPEHALMAQSTTQLVKDVLTESLAQAPQAINLADAIKSSEHQVILQVLQTTQSRTEAAQKLGISPRTLRYKLAQFRDSGLSVSVGE